MEKVINISYKKIKDNDRLILHTKDNQYVLKRDVSEFRLNFKSNTEQTEFFIIKENNKYFFDLFSVEVILIEEFIVRVEEIEKEIKKEIEEKKLKEMNTIEKIQIEHLREELKKKEYENEQLKERLKFVIELLQNKVLKSS
jgi:hypothetical protein